MSQQAPKIPLDDARTLLLDGLALLDDPQPNARATPALTLKLVRKLGFVQLDSINIVERAHHHILWSRHHGYRPTTLDALQRSGRIFEHWTHDASMIPAEHFPHWRHRFARVAWGAWIKRKLGPDHARVVEGVLDRVRREGPLHARDFEHPARKSGPWWDWKPAKAALEYLWRTGVLSVAGRGGPGGFEKIYDLTERVLPNQHALPISRIEDHTEWACRTALERLGFATAREVTAFWELVPAPAVAAWCKAAVKRGEVETVHVEGIAPSHARPVFALAGWRDHLAEARSRAADLAPGLRILSPFDPLIRDRKRCERLFNFRYRFEAFVPEPKRTHGYYVLPVLEHARGQTGLVARLDPKLDRARGVLNVRRVWWEPGVTPSPARRRGLDRALDAYAEFVGARSVDRPTTG